MRCAQRQVALQGESPGEEHQSGGSGGDSGTKVQRGRTGQWECREGLRSCQHSGGRAGGEGGSEGNSYIKSRLVGSAGQWEEVPQAESERLVLPVVCWGLLTGEPSGGGSKSRAGLGYAGDVVIL